jgi:hypothetical protein
MCLSYHSSLAKALLKKRRKQAEQNSSCLKHGGMPKFCGPTKRRYPYWKKQKNRTKIVRIGL